MSTPSSPPVVARIERACQILLLSALFVVPFSTALTSIFVGLLMIVFALALLMLAPLRAALNSTPARLALALLAFFMVSASWSIAPHDEISHALGKYSKLLILPIGIALSLRAPALPRRALQCVMAGSAVLATSCYLVWFNMMPTTQLNWWRVGDHADAFAFKNHITLGILLGFAAMVCYLKATRAGAWRARAYAVVAGVILTIPVIFLSQGRTGYLVLFFGLVSLLLMRIRVRVNPLRMAAGLSAIVALFCGFYLTSANFKFRTLQLVSDVEHFEHADARSANGMRLSFIEVGANVVASHPLLGIGAGAFATAYAPTARQVWPPGSELAQARHQPHSEFMLVAVQIGLLGWLLYMALLLALGRAGFGARSLEGEALTLLFIIYTSTSAYNSLLWDATEGHWFLLLAACLYAGCILERRAQSPDKVSSPERSASDSK